MKFVFDCAYTSKDTSKCATNYAMGKMAKAMLEHDPGAYAYYLKPSDTDKNWDLKGLPEHERLKFLEIPNARDRYKEFFEMRKEWSATLSPWGTNWDWDIYVTTKGPIIANQKVLSFKTFPKAFVLMEPMPVVRYKKTVHVYDAADDLHLLTFAGYVNSDLIIVNTEHEMRGILSVAREFLSAAKVDQLSRKMVCAWIMPKELDFEYPIRMGPKPRLDGRLHVAYTQRLDKTERRPENVWEIFKYAFITERGVDFEVMTNSATKGDRLIPEYPFIRMKTPSREEFWQKLVSKHCCFSYSIEEGIPLSLLEASVHGVINIIKKENWSVDLYGEDYPWLIRNIQEGVAAIKSIAADYEGSYKRWLEWYSSYFVPKIKRQGNMTDVLAKFADDWKVKQIAWTKRKDVVGDPRYLPWLIHDNVRQLGQSRFTIKAICDRLARWDLTKSDFKYDDKDWDTVPLKRAPGLYETMLYLRHVFGWNDGSEPGEMWKRQEDLNKEIGRVVVPAGAEVEADNDEE